VEDYFLKIDGIAGESQDSKHKDEIELVSFSWGLTQAAGGPAVGAGVGAGRAHFKEFQVVMHVSKASPSLFLASATGKHIKEANLSVRRAGAKGQGIEYLKIKLSDLLVSSFDESGSGDVPVESVAFNFGRIDVSYTQQQPGGVAGGAVTAVFDLSANVKV
jgi:type VI secretion system secreted protein Hcp